MVNPPRIVDFSTVFRMVALHRDVQFCIGRVRPQGGAGWGAHAAEKRMAAAA